jgi:hypothetical protein
MAVAFLKHPGWGESHNSPFQIAMTLYAFSKSYNLPNSFNGPSNAALGLNFPQTLKFIDEVFLPNFSDVLWITEEHFGPMNSELQLSISHTLSLIKKSDKTLSEVLGSSDSDED